MTDRRRERLESRRYSNLMDLPGVERSRDTSTSSRTNLWVEDEFSYQERRFVNDFKPFFLLCQLSGMFPNKLDWKLSFSWGYWATYFCLFYLFIMIVLLVFYISQVRSQPLQKTFSLMTNHFSTYQIGLIQNNIRDDHHKKMINDAFEASKITFSQIVLDN